MFYNLFIINEKSKSLLEKLIFILVQPECLFKKASSPVGKLAFAAI